MCFLYKCPYKKGRKVYKWVLYLVLLYEGRGAIGAWI